MPPTRSFSWPQPTGPRSWTRRLLTSDELEDRLAIMMGGRAAGARDDIQHATELCRRMVTEYGMSDALGSLRYAGSELQYLGGTSLDGGAISPRTREIIDEEVQRIVGAQYERAGALLVSRRAALEALASQLLDEESVDGSAVRRALEENPATGGLERAPTWSAAHAQEIAAVI